MGMYTGLRFKGYVKPEFREDFEEIAISGEWELSKHEKLREFGNLGRASFIPCGALSYMPDEWQYYDEALDKNSYEYFNSGKDVDEFKRTYNKETGYWQFQCSLKNYELEIQEFLDLVPYFIEKTEYIEYFYEEWEFSKEYKLVDNKVIMTKDEFIRYYR